MLAYFITAHGYGHGVRSCDILAAIRALRPDLPVTIVTDLPPSFFASRLPRGLFSLVPGSFDVGMVQLDSVRVDVAASLDKAMELCGRRHVQVGDLAQQLVSRGVRCVVADIPAVPLEAAAQLGIPGVAIGNFGWDWIYAGLAEKDRRWEEISRCFAEGYRRATLLLRLPFCEGMDVFPRVQDIPLVTTAGRERRHEIAQLHGCDPGRTWVLLSFTTLAWDADALERVQRLSEYEFFTVRPLCWEGTRIYAVNREQVSFPDLVASVDCVVSKPGFGIVSDCVVNRKPLVYADRSDFREYAVLESAIRRYLQHLHLPVARLYRGDLRDALESIRRQPQPRQAAPQGGAEVAARRILELLDGSHPCAGA